MDIRICKKFCWRLLLWQGMAWLHSALQERVCTEQSTAAGGEVVLLDTKATLSDRQTPVMTKPVSTYWSTAQLWNKLVSLLFPVKNSLEKAPCLPQQTSYPASLDKDPKTGTAAESGWPVCPTGVFVTGGLCLWHASQGLPLFKTTKLLTFFFFFLRLSLIFA